MCERGKSERKKKKEEEERERCSFHVAQCVSSIIGIEVHKFAREKREMAFERNWYHCLYCQK